MKKYLLLTLLLSSCIHKNLKIEDMLKSPKKDDRVKEGRLENGFSYYYMKNSTPKKQCFVRLYGKVGSFSEDDRELGMAHLIEHLAFQNTKDFPHGSLALWLQENGMSFGPDANAHTSYEETVYRLDLPSCDDLPKALNVFRNFAVGIDFNDEALKKEKAIIDREDEQANNENFKVRKEILDKLYSGTFIAKKPVIGKKAIRDKFTIKQLEDFYNKWYRPHNFSLVVVGDFKKDPKAEIEKAFGDWKATENRILTLSPPLDQKHKYFVVNDKNSSSVVVSWFIRPIFLAKPNLDLSLLKDRLAFEIVLGLLRQRLSIKGSHNPDMLYTPSLSGVMYDKNNYELSLVVESSINNFEQAFKEAFRTIKKARSYGFKTSDVENEKQNIKESLKQALIKEQTNSSLIYVDRIINHIYNQAPILDTKTNFNIISSLLKDISAEDIKIALNNAINLGFESFYVVLDKTKKKMTEKDLQIILDNAKKQEIKDFKEYEKLSFQYDSSSCQEPYKTGTKLNNGIDVLLKKTNNLKDNISLFLVFDDGLFYNNKNEYAQSMLAKDALPQGGLNRHSYKELQRLVEDKIFNINFIPRNDYAYVSLNTRNKDIRFSLDLIAAYIAEPYYHKDALEKVREQVLINWQNNKQSIFYPIGYKFWPKITDNDFRTSFTDENLIKNVKREDVLAWHEKNILSNRPIIIVIGDFDEKKIMQDLSCTFGKINFKENSKIKNAKNITFISGVHEKYNTNNKEPMGKLVIIYPLEMGSKQNDGHRIIRSLIEEELRLVLREKNQDIYTPAVHIDLSNDQRIQNFLEVLISTPKERLNEVKERVINTLDGLAKNGISDEAFTKAKNPLISSAEQHVKTNDFWFYQMIKNRRTPKEVISQEQFLNEIKAIKIEDVNKFLAKYFVREKSSSAVVLPK